MRCTLYRHIGRASLILSVCFILQATGLNAAEPASVEEVQMAVEKGLFFVEQNSVEWWAGEKCSSCHHGPMLLFSHNIAKRRGFQIPQKRLDFYTDKWVLVDGLVHNRKSDGRKDAGGMLGAPLTMLFRDEANDKPRSKSFGTLMQIAGKDWQHDDGSWDIKVRLDYQPWIVMALESYQQSDMTFDDDLQQEIASRRKHTEAWINSREDLGFPETTEDLTTWLVYEHHRKNSIRKDALLKELLPRRRADGWWSIKRDSKNGHQMITAVVLFGLTSIGLETSQSVVAETQRLLLDKQHDEGHWEEGGRIFDDGKEPENPVYQMWTTALACAALSQTVQLPANTPRQFQPSEKDIKSLTETMKAAAKGYKGKFVTQAEIEAFRKKQEAKKKRNGKKPAKDKDEMTEEEIKQ